VNLSDVPQRWDLIVIGGGITGAGILREAARAGLKVLLLERRDFAWGTSSRSSKLIHGGLRYLKEGRVLLTKIAVEERERLLKEAPGLVTPLGFYLPVYADHGPGRRTLKVGLSLYDILARERQHRFYSAIEFARRVPHVSQAGLSGGFRYNDAQVDDARLVLRLIQEASASGARALNYTEVEEILRDAEGYVRGVRARDTETGAARVFATPAVINATGCWAEALHPSPEPKRHLRPLRGSHLVFRAEAFPLTSGFSFIHPRDGRAVFAVPWEGAVIAGTTDLDHKEDLACEPFITEAEVDYLLEGVQAVFPGLHLSLSDCICAYAGVRPVLSEGRLSASDESREHEVWVERGLVTVTGGKLTTFHRLTLDALKAVREFLPPGVVFDRHARLFNQSPAALPPEAAALDPAVWARLMGRYGAAATEVVASARAEHLTRIPGTATLWAELPVAARNAQIRHLDDLMLRRVRIGLLLPNGGKSVLKRVQKLCTPSLGWDRKRWRLERRNYLDLWHRAYALPHAKAGRARLRRFNPVRRLADRFARHWKRARTAKVQG